MTPTTSGAVPSMRRKSPPLVSAAPSGRRREVRVVGAILLALALGGCWEADFSRLGVNTIVVRCEGHLVATPVQLDVQTIAVMCRSGAPR